jgi:hypothetical protein
MSEVIFTDGLIVKEGHFNEGQTHLKLSFKVEDFAKFVKEHSDKGWLNLEVKTSRAGKVYSQLDTWKPEQQDEPAPKKSKKKPAEEVDDLPF